MGSTGDPPVPVGDSPTGRARRPLPEGPSLLGSDAIPVPPGESPGGIGRGPATQNAYPDTFQAPVVGRRASEGIVSSTDEHRRSVREPLRTVPFAFQTCPGDSHAAVPAWMESGWPRLPYKTTKDPPREGTRPTGICRPGPLT